MRICYLSPGSVPLPPAPSTSVEIYVWNLAKAMSRNNQVLLYGKGTSRTKRLNNLTTRTFVTRGGLPYVRQTLQDLKRKPSSSQIIQVENRVAFIPAVKHAYPHTPVILNLHSNVLIQSLPRSTVHHSLRTMDAMVVNSRYLKQFLLAKYPVLQASQVHVIPPGIDVTKFPSRFTERGQQLRSNMRRSLGVPGHKKIILYVRRFIPRKGISLLLDAFRQVHDKHPESELWIIGGKPSTSSDFHHTARNKAQGLPVRFLGFINQSRLPAYYLAADIFVCPSQKPESFGMVNLEASATGLPVVASDAWGLRESVKQGVSGVLVKDYTNPAAFAEAIQDLLANPTRLDQLGHSARHWVASECSWEKTASRFHTLYQRLRTT
ncbi:MAG: glycosyltransferase family 4 protein [Tumebacillaceae bacterium]